MTTPLLELIELLEKQDYFDKNILKREITLLKKSPHSPTDKLLEFANLIDDLHQNTLSNALNTATHRLVLIQNLLLLGYFVFGFSVVAGLLATQIINFFYIFMILLGWHSLSLGWWLVTPISKKTAHLHTIIDKFSPSTAPTKQAFMIALKGQSFDTFIHKTALCSLFGSFLALLALFLVKSYQFSWQSTLLTENFLQKLINVIGFVPSFFGIHTPTLTQSTNLAFDFAILILVSVVIYGIVPRLLALLWCTLKPTAKPKNSDYSTRLLTEFSHTVIDKDDFIASPVKSIVNTSFTQDKIFASLELAHDKLEKTPLTAGIIDSKEDLIRLKANIEKYNLTVCLIINSNLVADRGIIRKIDEIAYLCQFGLLIELTQGIHIKTWQQVLTDKGIIWEEL